MPILRAGIQGEEDVVAARQRARQIAAHLGFDHLQQTRIATAVSEIARNAFKYARGGRVEFSLEGQTPPQVLVIRVTDSGPGIPDLRSILEGRYSSRSGMGLGITGSRRLMDRFEIDSPPAGGVNVRMTKVLPDRARLMTAPDLARLAGELTATAPANVLGELQEQNRELLTALEELAARQDDLVRINRELEDTNRGVVALYAELDERADHLRRADDMKSRFLSNMSHEFRTPLNSILALSNLLLDRADGPLTEDQERQVYFVRKSAESLYELVNDLLDLAKVEAGKITLHPAEFDVNGLFGALRGMLRPLLVNTAVNLVFDAPAEVPSIISDEAKVSQILRNFISNALKFTERGEVRVTARVEEDRLILAVSDTGIGIAPQDQERIFEEFTQVESPIQRKVKGTGLGLPLSRKLAGLLGGSVKVQSELGSGSTFSLVLPLIYPPLFRADTTAAIQTDDKSPVLVVEDHYETRVIYQEYLRSSKFHMIPARTISEARSLLENIHPDAIVLDLLLDNENACSFLAELKASNNTKEIPVLVISTVEDPHKIYGLGADLYAVKPVSKEWLLESLGRVIRQEAPGRRVLLIDDDPAFRYLTRQIFGAAPHHFIEAEDGIAGVDAAVSQNPELIFLDLIMPRMNGLEVLEKLLSLPETRDIPVIVSSSRMLSAAERRQIENLGAAILSKDRFAAGTAAASLRDILVELGLSDLLRDAAQPSAS